MNVIQHVFTSQYFVPKIHMNLAYRRVIWFTVSEAGGHAYLKFGNHYTITYE